MTGLFLLFFCFFFLLEVLVLDFLNERLSSSTKLPFIAWDSSGTESSGKTLPLTGFSLTKGHDNSCIVGRTEKRRKITSICRLLSAYPPNKLPTIPPKAMVIQDIDWRSPANEALVTSNYEISENNISVTIIHHLLGGRFSRYGNMSTQEI